MITGSARGMGAVEAEVFASEGATVIVSDVLDDVGKETARSLGTDYLHLDVTSQADWARAAAFIEEKSGRLDILVNNAGIVQAELTRFDEIPFEQHLRIFDVNVHGTFLGLRATLPLLEKGHHPSVINISSIDGLAGVPWLASYVASKHAVLGLSRAVAIELGSLGIRVNTIHPGIIQTPIVHVHGEKRFARLERTVGRQPLPRVGSAAEVAALALFLASDESSYCTGSEFRVDGGHLTGPYRELPV
ncbi:SDR family oxidoreductase [Nonomuraea sp. NPDC005650]|uniref:SDR family NAD(P)-dependent oxidoreductase n=1 Tax=Nonomuraea sp. NPDC005650 TaxID=3157045 RepID=UPI0033A8C97A